jgi:DNA-binding NarL/FixJ family response regulator
MEIKAKRMEPDSTSVQVLSIERSEGALPAGSGVCPVPFGQLASLLENSLLTILLVDLETLDPDQNLEFLARIGRSNGNLRSIALGRSTSPTKCEGLLRAGFCGVLDRECSLEIFQKAIRAVIDGQLWFPREIISRVLKGFLIEEDLDRLTAREVQILELIGDGLNNQQIADKLFISRETVRWHVRGLNAKLGIKDRRSAHEYLLHLNTRTQRLPNASTEHRRRSAAS